VRFTEPFGENLFKAFKNTKKVMFVKSEKVNLSLCVIKHCAIMKTRDSGSIAAHLLTSALDGGEWSASRPGRFTPGERAPGANWIGGWVGPRGLDAIEKRKSLTLPVIKPRPSNL
jgi:hypothetical protein